MIGEHTTEHLLDYIENIKDKTILKQLSGFLATVGQRHVGLFHKRLDNVSQDERPALNLLYVLSKIGTPEAREVMLKVADHPQHKVRYCVVAYSGEGPPSEGLKNVLFKYLKDSEERVSVRKK